MKFIPLIPSARRRDAVNSGETNSSELKIGCPIASSWTLQLGGAVRLKISYPDCLNCTPIAATVKLRVAKMIKHCLPIRMPRSKDETFRRFRVEPDAHSYLVSRLAPEFELWEDVRAKSAKGDVFSFDLVSKCRTSARVIGWEIKRSPLFKSEFASTLRQAIHYRLATIADPRLPNLAGSQLPAVAVFPDWDGTHDDGVTEYGREAEGMRVLANQFKVGAMRLGKSDRLSLIMGESAIWHSDSGWNGNAENVLYGKRSLGAIRKHDQTAKLRS